MARAQFAAHGYDATTVAAVADAADVSRAVVYETIGDKAELFAAVCDQVSDELLAAVDVQLTAPATLDAPIDEVVRADVVWFMDLLRGDPTIAELVRTSGRFGGGGDDPVVRARRRIEDRLHQLHVDRARQLGVEPGPSLRLLAVMVLSLVEAVAFRSGDEADWPAEETAAAVAEFAVGGYGRLLDPSVRALVDLDRAAGRVKEAT